MKIALFIFLMFIIPFYSVSQDLPARIGEEKMVNDYARALSEESTDELEARLAKLKRNEGLEIIFVIVKNRIQTNAEKYSSDLAKTWNLSPNSLLIVSDIQRNSYGFYVGQNLTETFPKWVNEKIEINYLKPEFSENKYFEGIQSTIETLAGIKSGIISPNDLKKTREWI